MLEFLCALSLIVHAKHGHPKVANQNFSIFNSGQPLTGEINDSVDSSPATS